MLLQCTFSATSLPFAPLHCPLTALLLSTLRLLYFRAVESSDEKHCLHVASRPAVHTICSRRKRGRCDAVVSNCRRARLREDVQLCRPRRLARPCPLFLSSWNAACLCSLSLDNCLAMATHYLHSRAPHTATPRHNMCSVDPGLPVAVAVRSVRVLAGVV